MEQDPGAPKRSLPIVTIVLIATNIAAWVLTLSVGADPMMPSPDQMFQLGGNFGPATFDGESWRLLSAMFLHFGIIHLVVNMLVLGIAGYLVEPMYGRARFVAIYLFAGLAGGIASALGGKDVAAGASGAIFGVIGAWIAFLLLRRRFAREIVSKQATMLIVLVMANIGMGIKGSSIDLRAHIGGLAAGFVAGLVLASDKQQRARLGAVFVASALAIVAAHVIPPPKQRVLLASAKEKLEQFAKLESKALDRYNQLANDEKLTEEEIANAIEHEILPVWREGRTVVWSAERLPSDFEINLRGYIETRERAWVTMIDALRKKDETALQAAMKMLSESDQYIEKLKR